MQAGGGKAELAVAAHGEIALASAKVAYRIYQEVFEQGERFRALARQGATRSASFGPAPATRTLRTPTSSTVEPLIGPDTVNTMPIETLDAYRGSWAAGTHRDEERRAGPTRPGAFGRSGIEIDQITQQLEDEGVRKFDIALDRLLEALEQRRTHG